MGLGSLYYYAVGVFLCAYLCNSHIKLNWPEDGYHPHSGMGNVWAPKDKPKPEGPRKRSKDGERRRERSRARDPRRDSRRDRERSSAKRGSERDDRRSHTSRAHFTTEPKNNDYRNYVASACGLGEPCKPIQRWR